MRFCEYIQDYRKRMLLTYVGMARTSGVIAPTVRAHCHGRTFPHYEVFHNYIASKTIDLEDMFDIFDEINALEMSLDDVRKMSYDDIIIVFYSYFKREERKYRRENKV